MFDSYTVKKVLPRLFIAIILIQLSWFLFTGVIKAVNLVAYGVEGLIYAPFEGLKNQGLADILSSIGGGTGLGLFSVMAAAATGVIVAVAVGGILMTAGIVLLGVLIAFALLLFRQVMVVGLLIIAPLALVAWILPSTEKYWKLWWDTFFKLLLVYPIILGMIAIGRVMGSIVAEVDPASGSWSVIDDMVTFIFVIACVIGPFFLIPKTFQMAGGAFAALSGAVNNRGAGAKNWMKKRRGATVAQNRQKLKEGTRYKGKTWIPGSQRAAARFGKISHGASLGMAGGFGLGTRGQVASDGALGVLQDQKMKSEEWQGHQFKDDVMRALTYENRGQAEAEIGARLDKKMEKGEITKTERDRQLRETMIAADQIGYGRASQVAAVKQLTMNKSGFADSKDAIDTINRVAGGNTSLATSMRESTKFVGKQVGRNDLGALRTARADESPQDYYDNMTLEGAETADGATLARNHAKSVEAISAAAQRKMASKDPVERTKGGKIAGALEAAEAWAALNNTEQIDGVVETAKASAPAEPGEKRPVPTGEEIITPTEDGTGLRSTPVTKPAEEPYSLLDEHRSRREREANEQYNDRDNPNNQPPADPGDH